MAINEVLFPTVPNPVSGDWSKAVELIEHAYKNINNPLQVDGSNVPEGAVFQVGAHVYHADSATAITDTASDYVKLEVSGTTLVPSFVVDLTGVTWNSLYGGYYDTSGNLYVFDEVKAILAGDLVGGSSKFAELWNNNFDQRLKTTDDVTFNSVIATGGVDAGGSGIVLKTKVIEIGDWDMDSDSSKSILHGLDLTKIRSVNGIIRNDADTLYFTVSTEPSFASDITNVPVLLQVTNSTEIIITRRTDYMFDTTSYDSTSYNRGWITILYAI